MLIESYGQRIDQIDPKRLPNLESVYFRIRMPNKFHFEIQFPEQPLITGPSPVFKEVYLLCRSPQMILTDNETFKFNVDYLPKTIIKVSIFKIDQDIYDNPLSSKQA